MLAGSDAVVSAVDGASGSLAGFARALSDGVYRSTIFDLIVAPPWRRRGLGQALVEAILAAPALRECLRTDLVCGEDVAGFYQGLGFQRSPANLLRLERARS